MTAPGSFRRLDRRHFIATSSLFGLTAVLGYPARAAMARTSANQAGADGLAYVACYTPSPETNGTGSGVALVRLDPETGRLSLVRTTPMPNASWVALDPRQRMLYALSEDEVFHDPKAGSVSAYAIDPSDHSLRKLDSVSSGSPVPCYISVHPSGRYLLVANYDGGSVSVLPINQDNGSLGAATYGQSDQAPLNPPHAKDSAPGNNARSDHSGPRMHMIRADPSGRFVIAVNAGLDRLLIWSLELSTGKLVPAAVPAVALEPGSAPRHLVFGQGGRILYVICEQDSIVRSFHFDAQTGGLVPFEAVRTLPNGFAGSNLAAEVVIAPSGRFLYVTQRLHDAISVLRIRENGSLELIDETWTRGDYPRGCAIDLRGRFLFTCNQKADNVTGFRIDPSSGKLSFTGDYLPIGSPVDMSFLS